MTEDILAEFRGSIYESHINWTCGITPFTVVQVLVATRHRRSNPLIEIKLLNKSKQHFCSSYNGKRGHASVSLKGIKDCKKIGYMDIMEYIKSQIL